MDSLISSSGHQHLAFIYGTLKKSQRNADLLADPARGSAKFVGEGRSITKYPLVVATEYKVPFLMNAPGRGHLIKGEVYEVDDSMLQFLDDFEGHPNLYRREKIAIQLTTDKDRKPLSLSEDLQCSTYFLSELKEDFLQLTWLQDFAASPEENVPKSVRDQRKISLKSLVFPHKK